MRRFAQIKDRKTLLGDRDGPWLAELWLIVDVAGWDLDRKGGALSKPAANVHGPPVRLRDRPHDGEAEPSSLATAAMARSAVKSLEDLTQCHDRADLRQGQHQDGSGQDARPSRGEGASPARRRLPGVPCPRHFGGVPPRPRIVPDMLRAEKRQMDTSN